MSSNGFWEKAVKNNSAGFQQQPIQEMVLDEEAVAEIQGDPQFDVFEDEEEETADVMSDVNLRLEQGRLYQMVLQGNIFADTNADPKAIRNVQREIRKFVRERMETMVGIRQEQQLQTPVVSSPFNDLEVTALKMLASKVSKGATENFVQSAPGPQAPLPSPKKDGITSISGNVRPQTTPTVSAKSTNKNIKSKPVPTKSAIDNADGSALQKPIDEMTPAELAAYDAAATERRKRNYAAIPQNLVPHPSPQQLEMMYTMQAAARPIKLAPQNS